MYILKISVLFIFIFSSIIPGTFASEETNTSEEEYTYFTVTAYYSPIPKQSYYLRGNYIDEVILNGKGIRGASGKAVYPGMLARPGKYSFGTAIRLEGIGTGVVDDRGGAIVEAGKRGYEYDRIDIWMGFGEEGLARAISWGKRTVKGKILGKGFSAEVDLNNVGVIKNVLSAGAKKANKDVTAKDIYEKSSLEEITSLQEFLRRFGFYEGVINGLYSEGFKDAILAFQKKYEVIKYEDDEIAGHWESKTADRFIELYLAGKIKEVSFASSIFDKDVNSSSTTSQIKEVQKVMKDLAYYTGSIDGIYRSVENRVFNFQLDNSLVLKKTDLGAGNFGPKTRAKAKIAYDKYLSEKSKYDEILKKIDEQIISKIQNVKKGETSKEVRILQNTLKILGYYNEKDTAIFGKKTLNALTNYQIKKGLILSQNDTNAGVIGKSTLESIRNDLLNKYKTNTTKQKLVGLANTINL